MLKEIRFQNFRCFKDLKIEGLQRFNIFGGKNNVGKTAVLEGIFFASGAGDIWRYHYLDTFRNSNSKINDIEYNWKYFYKKSFEPYNIHLISDLNETYEMVLKPIDQEKRKIQGGYIQNNKIVEKIDISSDDLQPGTTSFENFKTIPSIFLPAQLRRNLNVDTKDYKDLNEDDRIELIKLLKKLDNRIDNIDIIDYNELKTVAVIFNNGNTIPINFIGTGVGRFFSTIVQFLQIKDGILIIDELENGIYYGTHEVVIEIFYTLAEKYNVQIFATTHSRELVEAAHRVFSKKEGYPFRYYRLDEVNGDIVATGYRKEIMESALEMDMEVR